MGRHTNKGQIVLTEGRYDSLRTASDVKILTASDGTAGNITGGKVFIRCGTDPAMKEKFLDIAEVILNLLNADGSRIRQTHRRQPRGRTNLQCSTAKKFPATR